MNTPTVNFWKVVISAFFACVSFNALSQTDAGGMQSPPSSSVYLLTCWPGQEFFQLEGHTALLIDVPEREPYVVNWGVFDFNSPNFAYRFTKGETDYMAAAAPLDHFLYFYHKEGRCVMAQKLNLTDQQAQRLVNLVDENLLPENRLYRYNYILDNCATRPLALIEKAIGDTLTLGKPAVEAPTFREAMRYYHEKYPWYQFGIDLALGSGIDRRITEREMSFSPMDLYSQLRTARLPDGRPAVTEQRSLTGNPSSDRTLDATPWWLTPGFIAILVFCITIATVPMRGRVNKLAKGWVTFLYTVFGLAGLLLCFLVFVSVHEATSPNWLLLWLNPLCFVPAVGIWLKSAEKLVMSYQILNFALLIALIILFLARVQEPNPAFGLLIAADLWCSVSCLAHGGLNRWRR